MILKHLKKFLNNRTNVFSSNQIVNITKNNENKKNESKKKRMQMQENEFEKKEFEKKEFEKKKDVIELEKNETKKK